MTILLKEDILGHTMKVGTIGISWLFNWWGFSAQLWLHYY